MKPEIRPAVLPRAARVAAAGLLLLGLAACRQDMHDQPKLKPLAKSDFFADGRASRPLPAHTVAQGQLHADKVFYTGKGPDEMPVAALPMPVTRQLLVRGQERFNIFCSPCHGRLGDGRGMVVRRGYKQPPSYHDDRLRSVPVGYFFDVMTNGFGVMSSYAAQVPAEDRWAIAAYIRALQLSQHVEATSLSPEERAQVDASEAPAAEPQHGEGH